MNRKRLALLAGPIRDVVVVLDHLGDHKVEPFLGELGIKMRILSEATQPLNLPRLSRGIRAGHLVFRLQFPDLLCAPKALREHVHECRIDVVDT